MIKLNFLRLPIILYKMLIKSYFYWFLIIQGLFIVIFIIFDLFAKLDIYMNSSSSIFTIVKITLLLVPKSTWQTLPISIMFSITMTIGTLYQNNELVAIFTSSISIYKFVIPVIALGLILSFVMIFGDSYVVIPTFRQREKLFDEISRHSNSKNKSENNNDVTIRGKNDYFWHANNFTASTNTLTKVIIFKVTSNFNITYRLDAASAIYTRDGWLFRSGIIREWDKTGDIINSKRFFKKIIDFPEKPRAFKNSQYDIENMTIIEAKERIKQLKELNIEHNKELKDYYKKFSFPLTLLIVTLFAIGVSTLSNKNIILLSLFFSVGLAIVYYIMMMILEVLATNGKIPPFLGAWLPIFIFLPIAILLVKNAKT